MAAPALAQEPVTTELPAIEVTTPSPVVKPKRATKPSGQGAAQTSESAPSETDAIPPGTTLDFGDQAFVPVTVATEREISATNGQTITDTLDTKPGIVGTNFAPGANRPIIRGLDSYRVRTQENGIGTHDVAAISEDHAIPVDPNAADRIEVVRGPATLRYGSQAIGGVVSVENERIPTFIPQGGINGAIKGGLTSVDEGRDGAFKVTAGSKATGFAVHADGFIRRAEDYDTPKGKELNTFVDSQGGSVGLSRVWSDGFVGVSFAHIESLYGIPGEEARDGALPRIDMAQDKVLAKGEWRLRDYGLEAVRFWFGASDYAHSELAMHEHDGGGHDDDHDEGFSLGSRFTNKEQEARVELQHLPVSTALGDANGAFGVHVVNRNTRGQSFEGESLLEPAHTQSAAAFWFEELDLTRTLRLQAAARIEHTTVDGTGWEDFHGEVHGDHGHFHAHEFQGERSFTPVSASLGLLYQLPFQTVARLTGQYVERAPDAAELFSKGMHEATGTFEVGNPFLDEEKAATAEVGLKKATGAFRFDASAYYTRYNGFIYRQLQGLACDAEPHGGEFDCTEEHGGHDHGDGEGHVFDLVFFDQRNATFYGLEAAGQYDVAPIWRGVWGIEGQYDFVRAEFEGGGNVPRIPPHRLGGGLYYRDINWFARAGVLHAFDQDKIGIEEIATPGYTLVSAEISYTVEGDGLHNPGYTIGLKGENLADEEVLNHASFKRREGVLEPGASVRLFGTIRLN
ncbi:TonB-dependent receptor [Hyphomicrobium sp.]|uniref:TonB-dependent receptor n=1 Tax=Hyphomicrobium sp. TaxID=82 RepID=UPI002E301956|nr:TonB-dependent receptor [Hyphomicrobium sp.]HEX2839861.1 TonB-dependent receptor [Hyphomicrobium sp.]